jgi:hypothetical protein
MVFIFSIGVSQQANDPLQLWNGKDFANWEFVTPSPADIHTVCTIEPGSVLAITGKPIGYLATIDSFENYKLHLEYRWPVEAEKNSNSGVLVHIASGPLDRNTWPLCFQVQTKITRAGDLLPMAGAKFIEPLSTPPGAKTPQLERKKSDSEKPLGEWNRVDIVCLDSTIECTINGVIQNRVTKCEPHAGKIGLQLEGFQYKLRNIWLTRLE